MVLTTFNKELYEKNLKADAYDEGRSEGYDAGKNDGIAIGERESTLKLIRTKLAKGKTVEEIADALEETTETIEALIKEL